MRRRIRLRPFTAAPAAVAAGLALAALLAVAPGPPEGWVRYADPQNRFHFSYPPSFGTPRPGTDSGFRDRVAAIRFSELSSGVHDGQIVLGGEAALTKGFVRVDIQAAGGLYDDVTLGALPEEMRSTILALLTPLSTRTFCDAISKTQHLDLETPVLSSLNTQQKEAIVNLDRIRNVDPKVILCAVSGDTVVFHKEATYEIGQTRTRQHLYGAIRFLPTPYSSFQLVRVTREPPDPKMLNDIAAVVRSFE